MPVRNRTACALLVLLPLFACGDDDDGGTGPDPDPTTPVATSVDIAPGTTTLTAIGDSVRLAATVRDQDGQTMADATVAWISLDTAVATVGSAGDVVAVADGEARIEAVSGEAADTAVVTVAPEAAEVVVEPEDATLTAIGDSTRLEAEVRDANGNAIAAGDAGLEWTSLDEAVATVDDAGDVEAVGSGEAEVVATAGGAADTAVVTVAPEAEAVVIVPDAATLNAIGDSTRLEAKLRDRNGNAFASGDTEIEWTSADETVATVNEDGWVKSVDVGTTEIAVAAGSLEDEVEVEVRQVPGVVTLIVPDDTLAESETVQLDAAVADSNGVVIPGASVTWSTSDADAADVDATGMVTAVWGDAVATVTATSGEASGDTAIVVLGKIAFVSSRTGQSGIYIMNSDGSGVEDVTISAELDDDPTWSPDGQQIAFTSARSGDTEVWVVNVDGTGADNLTATGLGGATVGGGTRPTWAPDGTGIAFVSNRDANFEIYVMDTDGTDQERVTDNTAFDSSPAWSPVETKLAFMSGRDGDNEIWTVDEGGTFVQLTDNSRSDADPAWSPDGTRIVFTSRDGPPDPWEIWVMDADGSNPTPLTDASSSDTEPGWSSDGTRIVFQTDRDGDSAIYVMDADGSNQRLLSDASPNGDGSPAWRPRPVP